MVFHRDLSVLSLALILLFINDLLGSPALIHAFADDSPIHSSSALISQPSYQTRTQSRTHLSHTLNSDLVSIFKWDTENLGEVNASNIALTFEKNEILPLTSINILDVQVASNLSWMDLVKKNCKI